MAPNTRKRESSAASTENQIRGNTRSTKKQKKLEPKTPVDSTGKSVSSKSPKQNRLNKNSRTSKIKKTDSPEKKVVVKKNEKAKAKPEKEKEQVVDTEAIDRMDVAQLLALGESQNSESQPQIKHESSFEDSSESDVSDFEEVKNVESTDPVIPKEGVNITLEMPNVSYRHRKKGIDMEMHLKRQINKVKKNLQMLMHKVHVLGWIAHLKFVNSTINHPSVIKSCAMLIKSKQLYPSKYSDIPYLERILKWFHKTFEMKKGTVDPNCTGGLLNELIYQFEKKQAYSAKAIILMFITLLRVLGLKARIVMSFQVIPAKPASSELLNNKPSSECNKSEIKEEAGCSKSQETDVVTSTKEEKNTNCDAGIEKNKAGGCTKGKLKRKSEESNYDSSDDDDDCFESVHFKPSTSGKKKERSKLKKGNKLDKEAKKPKLDKNKKNLSKKIKNGKVLDFDNVNSDEEEDVNFTPKSLKRKYTRRVDKKSLNSSEESLESNKHHNLDIWTEVFVEAEEKWLSVDVIRQKIHCIEEIYSRATHPVVYVVACNNDQTLKDVTKRYVPNWHSDTRKRRVNEKWWNETMGPYLPFKTVQDKEEDEDIEKQLTDKPLPAIISEYKDHPLYALKRHLLKFEGIYPPDAPTLGFIRGEPVYARECVVTLRSREIWYKEARVVRLKEKPYKIVKARPKYDKMSGEIKKDLPLELFGVWQTEEYIPPIAKDGKVPRNEYGNVDLFKPCMLPVGTVHLQIPGVVRVAKKLGIDCAPATVGFEFHSGGSHPVFDGVVVCQEFQETLLDHWNKEIDESAKRSEERKEKRVYGNWKRLIRGLLIREKLKVKYAFGENSDEEEPASTS